MLPIFRMIPVGGVFIAIVALVQALTLPGPSRSRLIRVEAPARGPLIERAEHPEWRQFLILAAIHRAQEILALRDLPDTPAAPPPVKRSKVRAMRAHTQPQTKLASLPKAPSDVDTSLPAQPSVEELAAPASEQDAASAVPSTATPTVAMSASKPDAVAPAAFSVAGKDAGNANAIASVSAEEVAARGPPAISSPAPAAAMPSSTAAPLDLTATPNPITATPTASASQEAARASRTIVETAKPTVADLASVAPPASTTERLTQPADHNAAQQDANAGAHPPAAGRNATEATRDAAKPLPAALPKEPADTEAAKPVVVAELPKKQADATPAPDEANITGSVVGSPATTLPIGIGEASSTELPVVLPRPRPVLIKLPRARPSIIPPLRRAASHHAKSKATPATAQRQPPDLFSALFDKKYRRSTPASRQQPQSQRSAERSGQSP